MVNDYRTWTIMPRPYRSCPKIAYMQMYGLASTLAEEQHSICTKAYADVLPESHVSAVGSTTHLPSKFLQHQRNHFAILQPIMVQ